MPLTNVFSATTLIFFHHYCRYRCCSPPPGLSLVLPFIGATGRSVLVLTVGQGTQVAQVAVVHTAIVAATSMISIFSEGWPWPRGLP
jgi:hypothetical protein